MTPRRCQRLPPTGFSARLGRAAIARIARNSIRVLKSRDLEGTVMQRAGRRNSVHVISMGYRHVSAEEWRRNDDQPPFSAAC